MQSETRRQHGQHYHRRAYPNVVINSWYRRADLDTHYFVYYTYTDGVTTYRFSLTRDRGSRAFGRTAELFYYRDDDAATDEDGGHGGI